MNFGFSLTVTAPVADQEQVSVATALVGVSKAVPTVLIDAPSEAARSQRLMLVSTITPCLAEDDEVDVGGVLGGFVSVMDAVSSKAAPLQTQWQWSVREDPADDDAAAAAFAAEIFLSTEAAEAALARRNLIVPSGRLPGGKSAHFTFEAWYENAPDRKAESVATVTVRAQKLVAAIRGGSRLVGASAQVEIDGSASRDPDDAAADLEARLVRGEGRRRRWHRSLAARDGEDRVDRPGHV